MHGTIPTVSLKGIIHIDCTHRYKFTEKGLKADGPTRWQK